MACHRWYTAWFLTCFFTASCDAGRPMLDPRKFMRWQAKAPPVETIDLLGDGTSHAQPLATAHGTSEAAISLNLDFGDQRHRAIWPSPERPTSSHHVGTCSFTLARPSTSCKRHYIQKIIGPDNPTGRREWADEIGEAMAMARGQNYEGTSV